MGHRERLHGHHHVEAATNAFRLLEAATIDGAACAGLEERIGSLTPGKQADVVLIRTRDINIYPVNNAIGTVVHAAERSNVDTVIIGGRLRKRDGVVLGVDPAKLRSAIDESCAHLFSAAGYTPDPFSESFAAFTTHDSEMRERPVRRYYKPLGAWELGVYLIKASRSDARYSDRQISSSEQSTKNENMK